MKTKILKSTFLLGATFTLLSFEMPAGWSRLGPDNKQYEMGLDKGAGQGGSNAATIKSITGNPKGPCAMFQSIKADHYTGKRIRMSGFMKSKDVISWAGLWLRIDRDNPRKIISIDNMQDRPVKGTADWTSYEIVLDVPDSASSILFGAMLTGKGQIWFDNFKLEVVDNSVPTTGNNNTEPTNLDFEH